MHQFLRVIGIWLTVSFSCLAVWVAMIEVVTWRGRRRAGSSITKHPYEPTHFA
jgi:hypothetical protein